MNREQFITQLEQNQKQEPKCVEAEEPFTPLELPGDEEWYCYIQTRDQV